MIRRTSPLGELMSLRQAMDRLFEDSFVRPHTWAGGQGGEVQTLPLDVRMTPDELVVTAALPGVKPDDVDVTVNGDTLTISGTTADEQRGDEEGYLYQEIRRGSFTRTVTLPADVRADQATARFENGMLTLSIPKAEEAKPRHIRITPTTDGSTSKAVGPGQSTKGQQEPGAASGSEQARDEAGVR
ncbi:MAG: Hsp20/alpha crystallin family protein [Chloroflexi bacterium]|nr:Hsp20/alpha crystallin family protein [Chloroflexota bacterium]